MSHFFLGLGLTLLCGRARARKVSEEPPPEMLQNLEFFMEYDLIKGLGAVEAAAESASKTPLEPAVRVSTTTRAADAPVLVSTSTQGKKK